jgi:hypothetical protein
MSDTPKKLQAQEACTAHPLTAVQIEKNCPAKLQDLAKRINAHLERAAQCEAKAQNHYDTVAACLREVREACDGGGFNAFHKLFCPKLGKSRAHELLLIASGKKTVEEVKTATRERVAKHRKAKKSRAVMPTPSVTVTDKPEAGRVTQTLLESGEAITSLPTDDDPAASAEARKAQYAALDGDGADDQPDLAHDGDDAASATALTALKLAVDRAFGRWLPQLNRADLADADRFITKKLQEQKDELFHGRIYSSDAPANIH